MKRERNSDVLAQFCSVSADTLSMFEQMNELSKSKLFNKTIYFDINRTDHASQASPIAFTMPSVYSCLKCHQKT